MITSNETVSLNNYAGLDWYDSLQESANQSGMNLSSQREERRHNVLIHQGGQYDKPET